MLCKRYNHLMQSMAYSTHPSLRAGRIYGLAHEFCNRCLTAYLLIYSEHGILVSYKSCVECCRELLLQSALPGLPNSPGNDTMPKQLDFQDSTDVLEAGYGGNLTFSDLHLLFESICCSSQQLLGSWYVNRQLLMGTLFDDLLPAAINALPVHTVGLAPPAHLSLINVELWSSTCDITRFPRIANSLISALQSDPASRQNASLLNNSALACEHCLFLGTATQPANFSEPKCYSTVQLINTTINCASFVNLPLPAAAAPSPSLAAIGVDLTQPALPGPAMPNSSGSTPHVALQQSSPADRFAPKASLVAGVIVAVCVAVAAISGGLCALLQWDFRRLQASYGPLVDHNESRASGASYARGVRVNGVHASPFAAHKQWPLPEEPE